MHTDITYKAPRMPSPSSPQPRAGAVPGTSGCGRSPPPTPAAGKRRRKLCPPLPGCVQVRVSVCVHSYAWARDKLHMQT